MNPASGCFFFGGGYNQHASNGKTGRCGYPEVLIFCFPNRPLNLGETNDEKTQDPEKRPTLTLTTDTWHWEGWGKRWENNVAKKKSEFFGLS